MGIYHPAGMAQCLTSIELLKSIQLLYEIGTTMKKLQHRKIKKLSRSHSQKGQKEGLNSRTFLF